MKTIARILLTIILTAFVLMLCAANNRLPDYPNTLHESGGAPGTTSLPQMSQIGKSKNFDRGACFIAILNSKIETKFPGRDTNYPKKIWSSYLKSCGIINIMISIATGNIKNQNIIWCADSYPHRSQFGIDSRDGTNSLRFVDFWVNCYGRRRSGERTGTPHSLIFA